MATGQFEIPTPWLGPSRGYFSDWATQRWVQYSGRLVSTHRDSVFDGMAGDPKAIGPQFFHRLAHANDLVVDEDSTPRGLVDSFDVLEGPDCSTRQVDPRVVTFYERTSDYQLDVWSSWCGAFQPFGSLLAVLFSRRLQQLNVPLSPLDTSLGISNRVLKLRDKEGSCSVTAWVRELAATGHTLYAGSYGTCTAPEEPSVCMRVVFPLPNGSAVVVMRPESHADGSLTVSSHGDRFGSAGFYFFVRRDASTGWARYVRSLQESIRVFVDPEGVLRADHILNIFGRPFLKLHYRMRAAV